MNLLCYLPTIKSFQAMGINPLFTAIVPVPEWRCHRVMGQQWCYDGNNGDNKAHIGDTATVKELIDKI